MGRCNRYAESQLRTDEPALIDLGTSVSGVTDGNAQEDENGDPILGCENPRLVPAVLARVLMDWWVAQDYR